jgi:homogentisate 1,2-dioxygenase
MTYYRQLGEVPRKRRSEFRDDYRVLYAEEPVREDGFFNDSSHLYHRFTPNALVVAEVDSGPAYHLARSRPVLQSSG